MPKICSISPTILQTLHNKFIYISDTGKVVFRKTGKFAGSINRNGYHILSCGSRENLIRCYAHHFAWANIHGTWPTTEIDHINGVKWDNRPTNLRSADRYVNNQNMLNPKSHNKTGFLGVSYSIKRDTYYASLSLNRKKKYIGSFDTPEEAHQAYVEYKRKVHPGCTL